MPKVILLLIVLICLLTACSSNSSSMEETTTQENSLFIMDYTGIEKTVDPHRGFYVSYIVSAKDDTRNIKTSYIKLQFPEEISDQQGNTYKRQGNTTYQKQKENGHRIKASQFFRGKLAEGSSHITVPVKMIIDNPGTEVSFRNISEESIPITRKELTIQSLNREKNTLHLEAEDAVSSGTLDWTLTQSGENIYPVFTNTEINEKGKYKGTMEFAFQPEDTFSLAAERSQSKPLEWEFSFVVPVE